MIVPGGVYVKRLCYVLALINALDTDIAVVDPVR